MSEYRAENFTTASSLQSQHVLQISAHLNVLGLRSIFDGMALNFSINQNTFFSMFAVLVEIDARI